MPFRDILSQLLGMSPSSDFWSELEDLNRVKRGPTDYYAESEAKAGLDLPFPSSEAHGFAQQSIQDRITSEEDSVASEEQRKSDLSKLIEAGQKASKQREFMQGTVPLVEDYESGIAIGGDPSRGSKDEIIARIRAQAAKMAGREGPSAGGGGFTTAQMTPEISQRLSERDEWTAGQDMRDASFEGDLARQRRDPQGSAVAGEKLLGLQKNKQIEGQQRLQNSLVSKIADGSGKVPFEQAMQLEAAGVQIPYGARGMAPEQFDAKVNDIVQGAGVDLNRALEAQQMGAPPEAVSSIVGFSRYIEQRVRQIKSLVDAGKMSRDEASAMIDRLIASEAQSSNAIKAAEILGVGQQGQQPAQIGE